MYLHSRRGDRQTNKHKNLFSRHDIHPSFRAIAQEKKHPPRSRRVGVCCVCMAFNFHDTRGFSNCLSIFEESERHMHAHAHTHTHPSPLPSWGINNAQKNKLVRETEVVPRCPTTHQGTQTRTFVTRGGIILQFNAYPPLPLSPPNPDDWTLDRYSRNGQF